MSSHRSSSSSSSDNSNNNIHTPYTNVRAKRQRTSQNDTGNQSTHHNRCVLLFDMDCFYAQCERVRLGLPMDVKLCLFQWNSVLAVTYPAREYGIKRGDSWDDVATKMKRGKTNATGSNTTGHDHNNDCYTIHLPILGHTDEADDEENNKDTQETFVESGDVPDDSIEASYKRIFELSKEEQLKCQKTENGRRRFHHQGKACLERYRLASMRIFAVVLESLQKRITQECGYSFVLERASIDEFYLDLTDYCYQKNRAKDFQGKEANQNDNVDDPWKEKTVVAGRKGPKKCSISDFDTNDPLEIALNRASQVSYWIRQDIWKILGFTMSAGISTNKTMAKLAASYGKPNGQAVLYPNHFPGVLSEIKITKVRNFGGKLGKTVLKLLLQYQRNEQPWNKQDADVDALDRLKATATMGDLKQIPLPFLIQSKSLSTESAHFVFFASQGVDHEEVKETSGALVKSITAFKSFTATKSHAEIFDRWLQLLANEIVERVARDTTRNKRYPKSCTLNYTYYTTPNGQRPSSSGSTRSQRQSKSLRLRYPSEREGTKKQKSSCLLAQTREKLVPIVKDHPLRGVGLSVNNFIASTVHHQAQEGTTSIQSFFAAEQGTNEQQKSVTEKTTTRKMPKCTEHFPPVSSLPTKVDTIGFEASNPTNPANSYKRLERETKQKTSTLEDKDLNYARKLQASFDRENYVLSTASQRRKSVSNVKKNTQRIDSFFKKR